MLEPVVRRTLFWLLVCIVLVLSVTPAVGIQTSFSFSDKVAHFAAFFVLSFLFLLAYRFSNPILTSLLFLSLFGLGIEVIQYFLPYRSFNLFDFVADILGVLFGAVLYRVFLR